MSSYQSLSGEVDQPQIGEVILIAPSLETQAIADGYLKCNGAIYSQAVYPDLYSKLGCIIDGEAAINMNYWANTLISGTKVCRALIFANNLFVAAGSNTTGAVPLLATSTDAITWTARTPASNTVINALTYGNGIFVYAGGGGALATSTDAITWTARTSGNTNSINALTYANGLFVYGGGSGVLATSTDAITWTARTSNSAGAIFSLTYGNNTYMFGASNKYIGTSTDAITWTTTRPNVGLAGSEVNALTYGNGLFVFGDSGGVIATSTDGITWTSRVSLASLSINGLAFGLGYYLYAGNTVFGVSTDGITWSSINVESAGTMPVLNAVTVGKDKYVTSGAVSSNTIFYYKQATTYDTTTSFIVPRKNKSLGSSVEVYIKAT